MLSDGVGGEIRCRPPVEHEQRIEGVVETHRDGQQEPAVPGIELGPVESLGDGRHERERDR